jgi:GrpB-like predicted nucleotidyltransferase (UPF0157 family)
MYRSNWWRTMEKSYQFCDYLRLNTEAVEEYSSLKKDLSIKYANDRSSYTNAKTDFIKSILKKTKEDFSSKEHITTS